MPKQEMDERQKSVAESLQSGFWAVFHDEMLTYPQLYMRYPHKWRCVDWIWVKLWKISHGKRGAIWKCGMYSFHRFSATGMGFVLGLARLVEKKMPQKRLGDAYQLWKAKWSRNSLMARNKGFW